MKQEQEQEDDGWAVSLPPKLPAQEATPPIEQEYDEDDSPRFEEDIPTGYSPGRRNNPIREAIRSNSGSTSNCRPSQTKQPLPHLARPAETTTAAPEYRPSSGNPVKRMNEYGRLDQYFVAGVEEGIDGMNLSDDGKGNGGHVDAW